MILNTPNESILEDQVNFLVGPAVRYPVSQNKFHTILYEGSETLINTYNILFLSSAFGQDTIDALFWTATGLVLFVVYR